jgi:hypothetical protein
MQNTGTLSILITGAIRHALTALAALLTAYGVTQDQADAFVGPAAAVISGILIFGVTQIWSMIASKKKLATDPDTLGDVIGRRL